MELREIRYFLALARTLNFTRAAETCEVTQPALTRAIQKLERELGGPLFARERGNTHLTSLGRLVLPQLEALHAQSQAVGRQAEEHRRLGASDLRLGVMCSIGPARLARLVRCFQEAHPGVAISMADATPDRLPQRLLAGDYDAALLARPELEGTRFVAEPLYTERIMVACARGHRFAGCAEIGMADLHGETYLLRVNCESRGALAEKLREAGATLRVAVRSEREDWIQSLVAAGLGVCFLPEFSVVQPEIVLRPVRDAPLAREICLVTVAGRRWSPSLARFMERLRRLRPLDEPAAPARAAE
jgi:DNA-binding transcriptional LysR family regulator